MGPQEIKKRYAELREQALSGRIGKEEYERELAALKEAADFLRAGESSSSPQPVDKKRTEKYEPKPFENFNSAIPARKSGKSSLRDAIEEAERAVERQETQDSSQERRKKGTDRRSLGTSDRRDPNNQIGPPPGMKERRLNILPDRRNSFHADRRNPDVPRSTPNEKNGTDQPLSGKIEIGGTIAARYTLITKLSDESTGELWRAFDQEQGDDVLIRFLPKEFRGSKRVLLRLRQLLKQVQSIKTPGINPVIDLFEDAAEFPFYVSQYSEGLLLDKYYESFMEENEKFFVQEISRIFAPIVKGLDKSHEKHILHRDIRPRNIIVTTRGGILLDHGILAEIRDSLDELSGSQATEDDQDALARFAYLSPEEISGKTTSPASDQYSLAVVIFELLSGHLPFRTRKLSLLKNCILSEPPPGVTGYSDRVNTAISKALSKNPEERFVSCTQFLAVLSGDTELNVESVHKAGIRSYVPDEEEDSSSLATVERKALKNISQKASSEKNAVIAELKRKRKIRQLIFRIVMLISIVIALGVIYAFRERIPAAWNYWIAGETVDSNGPPPEENDPPPDASAAIKPASPTQNNPPKRTAGNTNGPTRTPPQNDNPVLSPRSRVPAGPVHIQIMGVEGVGERFAFIVDNSANMVAEYPPLQLAKINIFRAFEQLGSHQKFQITFFSDHVTFFSPLALASADNETQDEIGDFIDGISPEGSASRTTIEQAIRENIQQGPDNIFLFISSKSPVPTAAQLDKLRTEARNIRISVVEFGEGFQPEGQHPLRDFALKTGGGYFWVDMHVHTMGNRRHLGHLPDQVPPPLEQEDPSEETVQTSASPDDLRRVALSREEIDSIQNIASKIYESSLEREIRFPALIRSEEFKPLVPRIIAASEANLPAAQYLTALMYRAGIEVKADRKLAFEAAKSAAESGCVPAMSLLAEFYLNGEGTNKNIMEEKKWLRTAASLGEPFAQFRLAQKYSTGETRLFWLQKSAEQNYAPAVKELNSGKK